MKKKNDSAKQNVNEQNPVKQDQNIEQELIEEADSEIENLEETQIKKLENQLKRAVADYQNLEKPMAYKEYIRYFPYAAPKGKAA